MPTINQVKQQSEADTPLLFFQCTPPEMEPQYWSTHSITFAGNAYTARVLKHNLFDLQLSSDDAMDGISRLSLTLANADSLLSQINANAGFKGAQLSVYFAFADLTTLTITTESTVLFTGIAGDPDEISEDTLTLSFTNKLSLQRIPIPEVRVQRSCPWNFPSNLDQRTEASSGGALGRYSRFYKCGYSADVPAGVGNLNAGQPFTSCEKSRTHCIQRGMFQSDLAGNLTGRFGGFEFVPSAIQVRTSGDKTFHLSPIIDNTAKYNDPVPLVYGTGWLKSPVIFARNDGNLTHMETILGAGNIQGVLKVIVQDVEIPLKVDGQDMTTSGWYSIISSGTRQGAFNGDFADALGNPLGDPHGSIATLAIVVPNQISSGKSTPNVEVLLQGLRIDTFNPDGSFQSTAFSNNPAWVILDILRRCGWLLGDLNLPAFAHSAAYCQTLISTTDLNGNGFQVPRFGCNLILTRRQSAATVVRGVRVSASLMLRYGFSGLLELLPETTLVLQQPTLPDGGNSVNSLNGGWPAYEFSDASGPFSGIAREPNGRSSLVLSSHSVPETSNRLSAEFQDEFNEFQQDSLSLVDSDDVALIGYEIASQSTALGITNFSQATRVLLRQLDKSTKGNLYVSFVTSFRALKIRPGDIVALTYQKEGFIRTPFRVVKIAPSLNFQLVTVVAQIHDDDWYSDNPVTLARPGRQPSSQIDIPRPLVGLLTHPNPQGGFEGFDFQVIDQIAARRDGTATDTLLTGFAVPTRPSATSGNVPIMNLSPTFTSGGGTLLAGQTYYYAVSALDSSGNESALSFNAAAALPNGQGSFSVALGELIFSHSTVSFNVYRGTNPQSLYRISSQTPIGTNFVDNGLPPQPIGPPDASFDHANFYYRYEYAGPFQATSVSSTSITSADMGATAQAYAGMAVRIVEGPGRNQERTIVSNTATTLTITPAWSMLPAIGSIFSVSEPSWRFAAVSNKSPVQFEVSYQRGEVIQISGRSANVANQEVSADLCPITRWPLGGGQPDVGMAPSPEFSLSTPGAGMITLFQVGFTDLTNTASVTSGTLQLFSWNELNTPSPFSLSSDVNLSSDSISLNQAITGHFGQYIQVGAEVMTLLSQNANGTYMVVRGLLGSAADTHASGDAVLPLDTAAIIVPFAPEFFENRASANFVHTFTMPDIRIVAAEFYVTNSFRDSQATEQCYTSLPSTQSLRTLSGGQFSIQVGGYLATQQNAAPPLVIEASHAIRDIRATVSQAAIGFDISVQLFQNAVAYGGVLVIASGKTVSASVLDGFSLPPLIAGALLTANIALTPISNPPPSGVSPGRDLTVTIRL